VPIANGSNGCWPHQPTQFFRFTPFFGLWQANPVETRKAILIIFTLAKLISSVPWLSWSKHSGQYRNSKAGQ